MSASLKEGAIVRFKSVMFGGAIELDPRTQTPFVGDFNGCEHQQWQVSRDPSGLWRFQSVSTGLYLGQDAAKLASSCQVVGTSFKFAWEVKEVKRGDTHHARLHVPNTTEVLDADGSSKFPGKRLLFWPVGKDSPNQLWIIDQDVEPTPPCQHGYVYKIVNSQCATVAHLEPNGKVSGFAYNEGRNQVWEAIPYDGATSAYMWYFKNVLSGLYLGISTGDDTKHETRVIGRAEPFLWNVIPSTSVPNGFRLNVPFTECNMDLWGSKSDPGTVIHLDHRRLPGNVWLFERVGDRDTPCGNPLHLGPKDATMHSESSEGCE